ncbi:MAG: hypothetical protein J6D08_03855 [Lachnospiraceae bacterium]|nr:hypothetical protein [Lachnospiraceae bacterium]
MKRKILAGTMALSLVLANSITAFAAPEATEDGGVFDAEYYADNNPDVEAVYGRDFNLLYQHFVAFGAQEGRLPFAVGTDTAAILETAQTESTSPESEETESDIVLVKENVDCPLTVVCEYDLQPVTIKTWFEEEVYESPEQPVVKQVKEGYEWIAGRSRVDNKWEGVSWYYGFSVDDAEDLIRVYDDYSDFENYVEADRFSDVDFEFWKGEVSYNGIEYPILIVRQSATEGLDVNVWAMVPQGYSSVYINVTGTKVENGEIVRNEDNRFWFQLKKY